MTTEERVAELEEAVKDARRELWWFIERETGAGEWGFEEDDVTRIAAQAMRIQDEILAPVLQAGRTSHAQPTWDYTFSVWPHERGFERVVYDLFRMGLNQRILVEDWTHEQFVTFREGLGRNGFTLREVERVPRVLPESVL